MPSVETKTCSHCAMALDYFFQWPYRKQSYIIITLWVHPFKHLQCVSGFRELSFLPLVPVTYGTVWMDTCLESKTYYAKAESFLKHEIFEVRDYNTKIRSSAIVQKQTDCSAWKLWDAQGDRPRASQSIHTQNPVSFCTERTSLFHFNNFHHHKT